MADADVVITTYGTAVRDVEALAERPWDRIVLDEAQAIKNPANETAQQLRRSRPAPGSRSPARRSRTASATCGPSSTSPTRASSAPVPRSSPRWPGEGEAALRALNGILVFRRTKSEPEVAAELPDRIDELDHCTMTPEQIGLYQAVLDGLVAAQAEVGRDRRQGGILAAITALKQICNHPTAYQDDGRPLAGRSGKSFPGLRPFLSVTDTFSCPAFCFLGRDWVLPFRPVAALSSASRVLVVTHLTPFMCRLGAVPTADGIGESVLRRPTKIGDGTRSWSRDREEAKFNALPNCERNRRSTQARCFEVRIGALQRAVLGTAVLHVLDLEAIKHPTRIVLSGYRCEPSQLAGLCRIRMCRVEPRPPIFHNP